MDTSNENKKSVLSVVLSLFLLLFFIGMIFCLMFGVRKVQEFENYTAAIVFESIGLLMLTVLVTAQVTGHGVRTGSFAPLIILAVIYQILLAVFCIGLVSVLSGGVFVLINLAVLFIYLLISIPIFLMGRK